MTEYDLLTLGRVSMDLFSLDIGTPFTDISAFDTGVGGSPTNIAIAGKRLGLRTAAITAVGEDKVGEFVLKFLNNEGVDTRFIPTKPEGRTGLAVLGIQPPDRFPLVFYRDNAADLLLSLEDMLKVPIANSRALLISGTALSKGTTHDATLYAAETAAHANTTLFIDLDLRPDQWSHPRAYGLNVRTILPMADVIIGTEEEFFAALAPNPDAIMAGDSFSDTIRSTLEPLLTIEQSTHPNRVLIVKRGARGVTVMNRTTSFDVPGFTVEVVNTVGAGDAFAGGLITARLTGADWEHAARFANACGALVVTRHGCAKAMPYHDEVNTFLQERETTP